MGGLTEFLPGYQRGGGQKGKGKFEKRWGRRIFLNLVYLSRDVLKKASEGQIKAFISLMEDPYHLPNFEQIKKGLHQVEFLVVQDLFHDLYWNLAM